MSDLVNNMITDLANREFIVFAGAGIPNGDGKAISWRELLKAFKEAEPNKVIRDINEVIESKYPDYAQEVFEALGKNRYDEILKKKLQAKNARFSSQQRDIIETAKHVVTTNFDDSFEEGLKRELEGRQDTHFTQSLPDLRLTAFYTNYSISYLHGRTNEECIVLKTEDYSTFYPSQAGSSGGNDNLEQFLRHLYEEHTILFIGVSFNDKYFFNALDIFYNRVKQNDEVGRREKKTYKSKLDGIQHYAFMQENMGIKAEERCRDEGDSISEQQIEEERKRKIERLDELKIKVVAYKEHLQWTDWFREIRICRRRKKEKKDVFSILKDPGIEH